MRTPSIRVAVLCAAVATLLPLPATADTGPSIKPVPARPLHVVGNAFVDDTGRAVQLRGVNRSSPETLCLGTGRRSYFYGPTDAASVAAIRSWGANAVRIPINEDCWLGRLGLPASGTAERYRAQLTDYTRLLVNGGLNVILDVHFAETTTLGVTKPSTGPAPMLDRAHGLDLWRSIATTFRGEDAVLFDLYNEPHSIDWACWRDGCDTYAGMQEIVNAVRETGATNVLLATGPSWGNELGRWLSFRPQDPLQNVAAGVHVYPESGCASQACLEERVRPVAEQVPVVVGEFGDTDCLAPFVAATAQWADTYAISYLAFTWNTHPVPCSGYHLIRDFDGTPTPGGATFRRHLLARNPARATSPRPKPRVHS